MARVVRSCRFRGTPSANANIKLDKCEQTTGWIWKAVAQAIRRDCLPSEIRPGFYDHKTRDLPTLLKGDLLVLQHKGFRPDFADRGAARIELTLHKQQSADQWLAFARPGRRLKVGDEIRFDDQFLAEVLEKCESGEIVVRIETTLSSPIDAIRERGEMPMPPYIRRPDGETKNDPRAYQTIYAEAEGAVAAPTAGLHFTDALFDALDKAGINRTFVTLHVGAGTFLPIKSDVVEDHQMHGETGILTKKTTDLVNATRRDGGRVIAVGSTSLRLLESAAAPDGTVAPFEGETDLFISPGYRFKAVDLFLTNFHLPRSTLFVLVSAFSGLNRMQTAYSHAIENEYRFFSYGDCCLLHPENVA